MDMINLRRICLLFLAIINSGATRLAAVETSTDATRRNKDWSENGTESSLPNEFATATVTEAAKSAHANVGGKSADQRMTRSGDRVVLPLWRSIELKNQTRLIENFDTGATDDVDTDRIARTTKTQSTSTDDLIYSTALDYSGHSPYSIGVAEATTILPWLRRANRSSGLMENDNSNPREKILNHLTTAKSTTDSHSGKPGQSTANLLTVMHAVQHDSHRSSSGGSGESGSAMFTTSAAFVRPRRPASSPLGSLLGSFDDEGQYPPARSQAGDNRGEQQLRRDKEQPRNSDDGDFYRQDEDESDSSNSSATRLYVCASDQILATSAAGTGLVTALSIMQLRRLSC